MMRQGLMGLAGRVGLLAAMLAAVATGAHAQQRLTAEERARGEIIADRLAEYLLSGQDAESGGWRVNPEGVNLPAITALVVNGLLLDPQADQASEPLTSALGYLLGQQQPDGGIYDTILPSYNTSCSISALSRYDDPRARAAIDRAMPFLLSLQWSDGARHGPGADRVDREHPFYGGVGYGRSSRPDGSNITLFLQALEDSGYEHDGEAVQRALVFLSRIQMQDAVNDMAYADGSSQGGFIYATSPNGEEIGVGESKAGTTKETLSDGEEVSRLRAYGSMTYAGFKAFAYAKLAEDDPRVEAARRWIAEHYTLEENPGLGADGFYYFVLVFGRAMDAWDEPTISTRQGERRWAADLIDRLAELQQDDGSVRLLGDRWMENDPVLISAYSLIALRHALNER